MQAMFTYPKEFQTLPELREHSGQVVEVLGPVHPKEVESDREEYGESVMRIRFADGSEHEAFETELELYACCSNPHHGFGEHPHFDDCVDWQG